LSNDTTTEPEAFTCPRRQLLLGAGAVGGVALLAACGSSGSSSGSGTTSGSGSNSGTASSGTSNGSASAKGLIALSAVPSDTAVAVSVPTSVSQQGTVLLTQNGGKLTALDATCTHMQCKVGIDGSKLACPCHGSMYTLTGMVTQGPAPAPLHPVAVKVVSGQVELT
jgi:Rieske Fe-S protein